MLNPYILVTDRKNSRFGQIAVHFTQNPHKNLMHIELTAHLALH